MDTGQGKFETINVETAEQFLNAKAKLEAKYPKHGGWFREGEIIEINGSSFRVKRVKPTEIVLKLVKRA